ncbi:hypothetical protein [Escherichia coli]
MQEVWETADDWFFH